LGAIIFRRVVTFQLRIAPYKGQGSQHEKQPAASRSTPWPTRRHREAKNAGNASALASLRAARKKGDFSPLMLLILIMILIEFGATQRIMSTIMIMSMKDETRGIFMAEAPQF
jgi:hypothetical protein